MPYHDLILYLQSTSLDSLRTTTTVSLRTTSTETTTTETETTEPTTTLDEGCVTWPFCSWTAGWFSFLAHIPVQKMWENLGEHHLGI